MAEKLDNPLKDEKDALGSADMVLTKDAVNRYGLNMLVTTKI